MTEIDEATLIAWVDGELDEVTRRRVDVAVAQDPALARRLAMHQSLRERLSAHYAPIQAEPIPPVMRDVLNSSGTVVPLRPAGVGWRNWVTGGAVAASLLLGLGIGRLTDLPTGPVGVKDGVMVAQGKLADALDNQLASAQQAGDIRMGLSFQREGGGWCRSFEGEAASGVACRDGANWTVQQLVPGERQGGAYRQASSGDSRIMATIDGLMEGAPADAAQEAAARARGWR